MQIFYFYKNIGCLTVTYTDSVKSQDRYIGAGKALDTNDPILPVQMPHGFRGVAVLWKKDLVKVIMEDGNRIQCIELKGEDCLLIISVCMPCKGLTDNVEDFRDCVDQLYEIISKYKSTHRINIGGDINEELSVITPGRRGQYFLDFVKGNASTHDKSNSAEGE